MRRDYGRGGGSKHGLSGWRGSGLGCTAEGVVSSAPYLIYLLKNLWRRRRKRRMSSRRRIGLSGRRPAPQ